MLVPPPPPWMGTNIADGNQQNISHLVLLQTSEHIPQGTHKH